MLMNQKQALFVDDDRFLLDMYALKFARAGYIVQTADSGTIALKLLEEGYDPDAIMVDIAMPGMDGFEFVENIRRAKLSERAAVMMLTNQTTTADVARAKALGVDSFMFKATLIPSEVLSMVEQILLARPRTKA